MSTEKSVGLLHPFLIPIAIWEDVSLHFIKGLPLVKGASVIVAIVDRLSKYYHLGSLPNYYTANTVEDFFVQKIIKHHEILKTMILDHNKIFISHFWKELSSKCGTTMQLSTTYHSETDGQMKIVNKTIEHYLRAMVCNNPK